MQCVPHARSLGAAATPAATFVQGPPPDASLHGTGGDGAFEPLSFRYLQSTDSRKRKHREISADNAVTTYEGRNYGEGVSGRTYQ